MALKRFFDHEEKAGAYFLRNTQTSRLALYAEKETPINDFIGFLSSKYYTAMDIVAVLDGHGNYSSEPHS